MAVNVNFKVDYGKIVIRNYKDNTKTYTIRLHEANCLAAAIYHYKEGDRKMAQLYCFWGDTQHLERCLEAQHGKLFDTTPIKSIELNIHYPNALKMLKVLTKYGYKVKAYNKAPKTSKK